MLKVQCCDILLSGAHLLDCIFPVYLRTDFPWNSQFKMLLCLSLQANYVILVDLEKKRQHQVVSI